MATDTDRKVLAELVAWLVSIEKLAHDVYTATAAALDADPKLSAFISALAENESQHAELMVRLESALVDLEDIPPPAIRVDAMLRDVVETPLKNLQAEVSAGTITRIRALELIAEVEFTEWNEVFLYVLGTYGKKDRDTEAVMAAIQEHERRIESFIHGLPEEVRPELDVSKLEPLWETRVLVVDDHALVREVLAGFLRSIGRVTTAASGEEALEATRRHFFDAVVSDLRMPNVNGMELYNQAVSEHADLANRFVFVSFDPNPEETRYIEEHGLSLLLKPFAPEDLLKAVRKVLAST